MPNKTQEYLNLAQQTAKELTRYWENWTDYLTTASRLYKYGFADQLMIYAQRPDATACASFDIWNNRMNRYVRRGSKGIALLDQSSSVPRLHYVFDVSDTGVRRNSRDPEVWQLGPNLVQPVSEMLVREYGVHHENLGQQIADICGKLVDSYWDMDHCLLFSSIFGKSIEQNHRRCVLCECCFLYHTGRCSFCLCPKKRFAEKIWTLQIACSCKSIPLLCAAFYLSERKSLERHCAQLFTARNRLPHCLYALCWLLGGDDLQRISVCFHRKG